MRTFAAPTFTPADPPLIVPYRVQIATSATRAVHQLSEDDWAPIRHQLAHIASLAATIPPPPKFLLEKAGFSPPLYRFRKGRWLVLYDLSQIERTLTVLHVLKIVEPEFRVERLPDPRPEMRPEA